MNNLRLILIGFISLIIAGSLHAQDNERWYRVLVGGNPVGYLLEKNEPDGDMITSLLEMNISIGRLGSSVNMETKTFQTEKDGQLVNIYAEMYISNEKKVESVEVTKDQLIINSQGITRKLPLDTKLTGPHQLEKLVRQQIEHARESIHYTIYSAELGMYLNGKLQFTGTEQVNINGIDFNAIVVEESIQELPYTKKKWLTQQGQLLKSIEPSPFGDMEVVFTNKENALSSLKNSVDLPEEQYGSSMAYANYRLSYPRDISSMKIRIRQNRPEFGFPDFSGEYQKIVSKTDNEIILRIDKPKFTSEHEEPTQLGEYLEPNAFLDNGDGLLIQKTQSVIGDETDDWKKVQLILQWVRTNMSFDAGIALADSREVIRDLKGTCVSYAMLTAAMCKAAGIPARFLMGYVYVDGAWGGHAWSEVNINGMWIPVDAAVPNNSNIADAARFYMARSSLQSGMGQANIAGMQLFGNIEVEILEYEVNGNLYNTTEKPYRIENEMYTNPGLKFSMKKLPGFEFEDLDNFYPKKTILKQTNGSSEILVEHWTYGMEEDAKESMVNIISRVEDSEAAQPFKTERFEGLMVNGANQSVAIIKDGLKAFYSLKSLGSNHYELIDNAIKTISLTVDK